MQKNPKILFILKRRHDYNHDLHYTLNLSTGLYNSAMFVSDMLTDLKIENKISVVTDNNSIDKEVSLYKPTHVIIEALWVVPSKFSILTKLHPNVKWVIRIHSNTPFIANEGIAYEWMTKYFEYKNVILAPNSLKMVEDLKTIATSMGINSIKDRIIYLPNYYAQEFHTKTINKHSDTINVGCFGAIRPLKNQLIQAIAAIRFADSINKKLVFHINGGRVEQRGENVLKNIEAVFEAVKDKGHRLEIHGWLDRKDFIELCKKMDIGLQVSYSETFNIVSCDLSTNGVPVIVSKDIDWMSCLSKTDNNDIKKMVRKIRLAYMFDKMVVMFNQFKLNNYLKKTKAIWLKYFKG